MTNPNDPLGLAAEKARLNARITALDAAIAAAPDHAGKLDLALQQLSAAERVKQIGGIST